ncbi:hypothetical protein DVVG_00036 [Dunaliella viridis virus SI2]|uniref:hypothetical protein n=1 Tax=Dunaliella viridis virus SI2 TaxID=754069 RepID=UPI0002C04BAD|nr:hypothetical protein DVVG_00036 [Dunaliella viridis virus SI2]AGH16022.1 hypothetical protein DVVG_00036 [Dunaliella viridis virus SI2]
MTDNKVHLQPMHAPWRDHVNAEEKQRLDVLEQRLSRKRATVEDLVSEQHRIMRRAIARMRRKEGKQK